MKRMPNHFEDVLRSAVAIQVALYELLDEDVSGVMALPALEKCVAELNARFKTLKKGLR